MSTVRIDVRSERSVYPVFIGPGTTARLPELFRQEGFGDQVAIVSSPPIWRTQGARLGPLARSAAPILIPDGERAKTLTNTVRLYDAFVQRGLDRHGTVVAFGGGVVGDVAGFAAATYLRGVRLVQIPTTLLAQVDSGIGGKVGVNLAAGKNLIGAFHPPGMVVCDPEVLDSLPRREFRSGLYEMVKYGVIASRPLFERLASSVAAIFDRTTGVLAPLIADCCRIKAEVVSADERESGLRRVLNFGHTVGHALEAVTRYRRFRHGEAVAYGMLAAADLSVARATMPHEDALRLKELIQHLGPLPPVGDLATGDVMDAMTHDKKIVGGRLHFVLCAGLGRTAIATDVTPTELLGTLKAIGLKA